MIELIPFVAILYIAFRPIEKPLSSKIDEIMSKAEPDLAKKLGIKNIDQIKDLLKHLEYRPDLVFDYTMKPSDFLAHGQGDCDDFSCLTYSLLIGIRIPAGVAIAYTEGDPESHAFTFYKCNNEYCIFSNKDFFKASSLSEAANMLGFEKVMYKQVVFV